VRHDRVSALGSRPLQAAEGFTERPALNDALSEASEVAGIRPEPLHQRRLVQFLHAPSAYVSRVEALCFPHCGSGAFQFSPGGREARLKLLDLCRRTARILSSASACQRTIPTVRRDRNDLPGLRVPDPNVHALEIALRCLYGVSIAPVEVSIIVPGNILARFA
jgi:hypothetical protein